jgi:hypothetical protein
VCTVFIHEISFRQSLGYMISIFGDRDVEGIHILEAMKHRDRML